MSRRTFLRASAGLIFASSMGRSAGAEPAPLRMVVHPYTSTLSLITTHRPLQQYLEHALARPVEFYTAANFNAFVDSLLSGEYDIVISPPHFAVLAIEQSHYLPLAHYQARLEPFLVVRKESAYRRASDLIGKRIAMADQTAFIRIVMLKSLADAGLMAGRHFEVLERPTHAASIMATVQGDADAGVAMQTVLKLQPPEVQQQVRTVLSGQQFPNLFTLAHRRLGDAQIGKIRTALFNFSSDPAGRSFFAKTGYGGYDPIGKDDIAALAPYVEMTRPLVARPR